MHTIRPLPRKNCIVCTVLRCYTVPEQGLPGCGRTMFAPTISLPALLSRRAASPLDAVFLTTHLLKREEPPCKTLNSAAGRARCLTPCALWRCRGAPRFWGCAKNPALTIAGTPCRRTRPQPPAGHPLPPVMLSAAWRPTTASGASSPHPRAAPGVTLSAWSPPAQTISGTTTTPSSSPT